MEKISRVKVLSREVIERISAGQVVDGPASVVKELLENSLDAGAGAISIEVEKGGKRKIRVSDNGSGIHPDDIELVFNRHTTSKISTLDDLWGISTFGFRGEALFSISNVSYTKLKSKYRGEDVAWEVEVKGGRFLGKRPSVLSAGTEVVVEELFFNVPARRKFLRSDNRELQNVTKAIMPYLFLRDGVDISFKVDNKMVFYSLPEKIEDRLLVLFDLPRDKIVSGEVKLRTKNIQVKYLFSVGEYARARKDLQFVFINGRPVSYPLLGYKVNQLYKSVLPSRRFPVFILWIDLPASSVDVNVHPMKREVKVQCEYELVQLVERVMLNSVGKTVIPANVFGGRKGEGEVNNCDNAEKTGQGDQFLRWGKSVNGTNFVLDENSEKGSGDIEGTVYVSVVESVNRDDDTCEEELFEENLITNILCNARILGVFMNKYGLMEWKEQLFVLDIHAAQERINYERLLSQMQKGRVEIQELLVPLMIRLSPSQIFTLRRIKEFLEIMGFLIEEVGVGGVNVYGVPVLVNDAGFAVQEILSQDYSSMQIEEIKEAIARRACRSSIMAGDKINNHMLDRIRLDLVNCNSPLICPHGRPTIISIKDADLEKMFQRR